jgi:hypothetical protein
VAVISVHFPPSLRWNNGHKPNVLPSTGWTVKLGCRVRRQSSNRWPETGGIASAIIRFPCSRNSLRFFMSSKSTEFGHRNGHCCHVPGWVGWIDNLTESAEKKSIKYNSNEIQKSVMRQHCYREVNSSVGGLVAWHTHTHISALCTKCVFFFTDWCTWKEI